jgi:riboflavin synthase
MKGRIAITFRCGTINPVKMGFFCIMFTGIITDLGRLQEKKESLYTFAVKRNFRKKLEHGTSVAVNGVCLTVIDLPDDESFSAEVMPESQKKTMLGSLDENDIVNLELPAKAETFLSGHIVQGHVDRTVKILHIEREGISNIVSLELPKDLQKYVVQKGSIAINGISLTVIDVYNESFSVGVIPFTWDNTMLHRVAIGDKVNIETDIFARYVEKLITVKKEN